METGRRRIRSHDTGCGRLDISFDACHLPCKEKASLLSALHRSIQKIRRINVRISMHHTITDEFRMRKTGDHTKDTLLLPPLEMRLEADDIVHAVFLIILAELNHRIGILPCARIRQSHRLHRAEAHRIFPACCHDFDRHAAFEDFFIFKAMYRCHLRFAERFTKGLVLLLIHRAVQVRRFALVVAGHAVHDVHIERLLRHDGCRRIIEMKAFPTAEGFDGLRQSTFCQRPRRDDGDTVLRKLRHLFFHDGDQWVILHLLRHGFRIAHAVDRKSPARRDAVCVRGIHDKGVEASHFFLQEADGIRHRRCPKGIAADKLCKIGCVVRRCLLGGTHLDECHRDAHLRELPGRFTSGKARTDYGDMVCHICLLCKVIGFRVSLWGVPPLDCD